MTKIKIIGLLGRSGTGKNTVADYIRVLAGGRIHVPLLTTSRPKRPLEIEGREYHFVKKEQAIAMIEAGETVWHSCFNDWFYYLPVGNLATDRVNLLVLNPSAAVQMNEINKRNDNFMALRFFELTLPDQELWKRIGKRPDLIEVCRRWPEDIKDFNETNYKKLPVCYMQNDDSNITAYMLTNYIMGMEDAWAEDINPHTWNPTLYGIPKKKTEDCE